MLEVSIKLNYEKHIITINKNEPIATQIVKYVIENYDAYTNEKEEKERLESQQKENNTIIQELFSSLSQLKDKIFLCEPFTSFGHNFISINLPMVKFQ